MSWFFSKVNVTTCTVQTKVGEKKIRERKLKGIVNWQLALKQKVLKQRLGVCVLMCHFNLLINYDIFKLVLPIFPECHTTPGRQHCLRWHGTQDEFQYFVLQEVSVPAINAQ
jgi:hypothetical protein